MITTLPCVWGGCHTPHAYLMWMVNTGNACSPVLTQIRKILLAKKNGKVIGRAVIRLTKGRDYLRDDVDAPTLEFADLTKPPEKRYEDERPADQLTLFLERPYFKNANYSETAVIKQMFISLVRKRRCRCWLPQSWRFAMKSSALHLTLCG